MDAKSAVRVRRFTFLTLLADTFASKLSCYEEKRSSALSTLTPGKSDSNRRVV